LKPRIMIGMPVGSGSIPWLTAVSLMSTVRACEKEKIPLRVEGPVGCSVVTWARDLVVANFLKSDCTHLFWIDSDIVWAPRDFIRLVGAACEAYDVIGATYAIKKDPPQVIINTPDDDRLEVNGHGNVRVKSLGLGFTCVKRAAIENLAAAKGKIIVERVECPDMFRLGVRADGNGLGEDIAFFEDLAAMGYKVWLDPSVRLGHAGLKIYECDVIEALGLGEFAEEMPV
jgi:hypothetical protein